MKTMVVPADEFARLLVADADENRRRLGQNIPAIKAEVAKLVDSGCEHVVLLSTAKVRGAKAVTVHPVRLPTAERAARTPATQNVRYAAYHVDDGKVAEKLASDIRFALAMRDGTWKVV